MNALDFLYLGGALLLSPIWARKSRAGWNERFGRVVEPPRAEPGTPRILLHAVSVGETNALRTLVPLLTPHAQVVISCGTDTGLARAAALFGGTAHVVRYPLDFSWSVGTFLDRVRPDAVGLVELEVWPNFVWACERRGVPVAVINGRLSERSFKGYRRIAWFMRRTFGRLHTAAVQDEHYARRFVAMGTPSSRVSITGSMKWDAAPLAWEEAASAPRAVPGAAVELARDLGIDRSRPLIVAGSTAEDEEALLHAACPPGVQLLCAPRKPEHFEEAAGALPGCIRRTQRPAGSGGTPGGSDRFLLDTIGELGKAYALADVVVMGRSFGSLFGSDPIEPAAMGRPVLIGPAYGDFASIVDDFDRAGGILRTTRETLARDLRRLIDNPNERTTLAAGARACILERRGASRRHADLLIGLTGSSRAGS